MGGYDIGASLSGSSSATSGADAGNYQRFGDLIVGGKKPLPPWLFPILVVGVVLIAALFLIRKH